MHQSLTGFLRSLESWSRTSCDAPWRHFCAATDSDANDARGLITQSGRDYSAAPRTRAMWPGRWYAPWATTVTKASESTTCSGSSKVVPFCREQMWRVMSQMKVPCPLSGR
ncbi:hypothetical protein Pden_0389 [Paracoccus denitrificans PD1222]|uniref:Uncharacterized protein n=1 Tax=Paracoccus denitrificans (strain Pd 1222) TaxID=318586 RepID=A1AZ09_PARDP|nr:hypothetical protein Pden_0389 [Paracoccus denitrificans PD1222]